MSPRSEDSHWVQCELSLALELKKPIFPLLLDGRRWLSVAAIQTVDVSGGKLPPARFFEVVRGHFPGREATAQSIFIQDDATDATERIATPQAPSTPRPLTNIPSRVDKITQDIKPAPEEDNLASERQNRLHPTKRLAES